MHVIRPTKKISSIFAFVGILLKITYYNFVSILCILFANLFTNRRSLFSYLGNKYTNNFIKQTIHQFSNLLFKQQDKKEA